jgi:signal transduction histidine kinase
VTGTPRPLPPAIEATVLRVAREALFNALKHAHATSIIVRLTYEARHVLLDVIDDGQGTDAGRVASAIEGRHWGMTDMRERAQRAGGTFEVVTAPGQGMRISMSLPAEPAF